MSTVELLKKVEILGTLDYEIMYSKLAKSWDLIAYSNSDWAEIVDDIKSTSDYKQGTKGTCTIPMFNWICWGNLSSYVIKDIA